MSIAVSALIKPSRIIKQLTVTMCGGCVMIGAAIGIGLANDLPLSLRSALAFTCVVTASVAIRKILQNNKEWQVAISPTGLISLIVGESTNNAELDAGPKLRRAYTLLPSSTLWSSLMILNLQAECGATTTLMILPDTVSDESFRALSVACHWIAARSANVEIEKA